MAIGTRLFALSERFRDMTNGVEVLDSLESAFREMGATHFMATGLPLPNRPIEPLVLRMRWGDMRHDRSGMHSIDADDPLLQLALQARRPFRASDPHYRRLLEGSPIVSEAGAAAGLVVVPVCAFLPYQAVVIAAGPGFSIGENGSFAVDHVCAEAFRRLFELGYLRPERPGDLSARERRVVELSALGKTANQIASILDISQRTVHAHLQNASEKLRARNKTHTVVEALRYGQISV